MCQYTETNKIRVSKRDDLIPVLNAHETFFSCSHSFLLSHTHPALTENGFHGIYILLSYAVSHCVCVCVSLRQNYIVYLRECGIQICLNIYQTNLRNKFYSQFPYAQVFCKSKILGLIRNGVEAYVCTLVRRKTDRIVQRSKHLMRSENFIEFWDVAATTIVVVTVGVVVVVGSVLVAATAAVV